MGPQAAALLLVDPLPPGRQLLMEPQAAPRLFGPPPLLRRPLNVSLNANLLLVGSRPFHFLRRRCRLIRPLRVTSFQSLRVLLVVVN